MDVQVVGGKAGAEKGMWVWWGRFLERGEGGWRRERYLYDGYADGLQI